MNPKDLSRGDPVLPMRPHPTQGPGSVLCDAQLSPLPLTLLLSEAWPLPGSHRASLGPLILQRPQRGESPVHSHPPSSGVGSKSLVYWSLCYRAGRGWFTINYYRKDSPLSVSGGSPHSSTHLLGSKCLPPEERRLSMPETGEKERNYLFKSYTDLE